MKFNYSDSLAKRITDTIGLPIYTFRKYVKQKQREATKVIGIPWYTEESWRKMKALAEDGDRFHSSYPQWLAYADRATVILTNRQKLFERLSIEPLDYLVWCQKRSLKRNSDSRIRYTQYMLKQKIKQFH